jgi:hypothetical protein
MIPRTAAQSARFILRPFPTYGGSLRCASKNTIAATARMTMTANAQKRTKMAPE